MNLIELVNAMPPDEQRGALKALDACTRPMTVRELEFALRQAGLSRPRATKIASSLRSVAIVAVTGDVL